MAEPKLRTIKIARRNSSVSRRDVTRAIKAVMKLRGEIPTTQKQTHKAAVDARK